MEKFMKNKIESEVEKIRNSYKSKGVELTEKDLLFIRYGISTGIMIAGLTLCNNAPEPF